MINEQERQAALIDELNNLQNKWVEDTRSVIEILRELRDYQEPREVVDEKGMTWEKAWVDYRLEQWCEKRGRNYRPLRGTRWSLEKELHPRYRVPLSNREKKEDD